MAEEEQTDFTKLAIDERLHHKVFLIKIKPN